MGKVEVGLMPRSQKGLFLIEAVAHGEALASFVTATLKNVATIAGLHALTETVCASAFEITRLKGSFHEKASKKESAGCVIKHHAMSRSI
jgi:hypothetical protein